MRYCTIIGFLLGEIKNPWRLIKTSKHETDIPTEAFCFVIALEFFTVSICCFHCVPAWSKQPKNQLILNYSNIPFSGLIFLFKECVFTRVKKIEEAHKKNINMKKINKTNSEIQSHNGLLR